MAQHDYVVANGTGLEVRTDLNVLHEAIATLNGGPSAPATLFPHMLWADETAGILKMRNEANTAWIDLARINEAEGTVATPLTKDLAVTAAGSDETDPTEVKQQVIKITGGGAGTGIRVVDLDQVEVIIINATGTTKEVYPGLGGAVDGGTANVPAEIPANTPLRVFIDGDDLCVI